MKWVNSRDRNPGEHLPVLFEDGVLCVMPKAKHTSVLLTFLFFIYCL